MSRSRAHLTLRSAPLGLALLSGLLWAGCNCGPKVHKVAPQLQVDAQLGFGEVPVGQTSRHVLKISNQGSATLNLRDFAIDNAVFAGPTEPDAGPALPTLEISAGGSATVELAYTPTHVATSDADDDHGTLSATTDDPAAPAMKVALSGKGTQASFTVAPAVIDFGDLELVPGQPFTPPSQTVTITNIGSGTAHIVSARLDDLPGVTITPPLDNIAGTFTPGYALTATLTFTPPDLLPHDGHLVLQTDYAPQAELSVEVKGRGVAALWQLCKQRLEDDGGAAEAPVCVPTPPDSPDAGTALALDFGGRDEGGPPALGRLWVQNVGNQAISVSALVTQLPQHSPCPGGPWPSDFALTHSTPAGDGDGGFGQAALDAGEQAGLEVAYAPQHHCATGSYPDGGGPTSDDIVDALQVLITRVPPLGSRALVVLVQGHSALPQLVTTGQGYSFVGTAADGGSSVEVVLQNAGERDLHVTAAEIRDAQKRPCEPDGGVPECARVSLADNVPLTVPPATRSADGGNQPGTADLGTLTVGPGPGGLQAYIHLESDDPHQPGADLPVAVH